jgi:predicted RNA-binding protein YlxR (DUF448 family)
LRLQPGADGALRAVSVAHSGRSAYLHADPACVEALAKSRLVKRSLRREIDRDERGAAAARLRASVGLARSGECS